MVRRRVELREVMDDPGVSRETLERSVRFMRRVNRYLGGRRAVLQHFRDWARRGKWDQRGETITVLDVATGSGDIPLAVLAWARRRGVKMAVTGLDSSEVMLGLAREYVGRSGGNTSGTAAPLTFVRGDALALPFEDGAFDYVTCSMFMHHLSEARVVAAIREMVRVSRRGVLVNDLLRTHFAEVGIFLLTLFSSATDKNDARVSVAKGWEREEVERWAKDAGAPWLRYHYHLPARFTLAGER